ncbi:alpha/beta fold hydrolase [Streptomyces sp. NPDC127098]|uniref:alpha/beta fold hydrolase n=1 Tax=Streptomyces sp. NPDC127098 TaxID=3347137 RepID=UPI00365F7E85
MRAAAEREREFRTLAWFTDHADRERAWEWAAEDAAAPHRVNWTANRRLAAETDAWPAEAVRDGCRRVTAPMAVVHGTGDPRPITAAAALADALPHGRLHALRDAGHHPWRERPTELRAVLRAALAANGHER